MIRHDRLVGTRDRLLQIRQPHFTDLPGPNAMKLQNRSGYRLRISDWRVIYEIRNDDLVILVLKIAQRGEVYR